MEESKALQSASSSRKDSANITALGSYVPVFATQLYAMAKQLEIRIKTMLFSYHKEEFLYSFHRRLPTTNINYTCAILITPVHLSQ